MRRHLLVTTGLALLLAGGIAHAQPIPPSPPPVFGKVINVFSYLTAAQQADVQARTRSLDLTAGITAAVAAVNATNGAQFVWPAGDYYTATCNFTLTAPFAMQGVVGTAVDSTSAGGTAISCAHNTNSLFTVNSRVAKFENIALKDVAASRSAGQAIYVTSAVETQKVDYEGLTVDGFYDGVNVGVGSSWVMHAPLIMNFKHYGVKINNTVNPDAGDWTISDGWIYSGSGATAGIRYESSGGGKIANTAILTNTGGTMVNCLSMDTTGHASIEFTFVNNKCDHASGAGLNIVQGYGRTVIIGNTIKTDSVSAPAIAFGVAGYNWIGGNNLWGGGGTYAITTNTITNTTFAGDQLNGFTNYLPAQDTTNRVLNFVNIGTSTIQLGNPTATTTIGGLTKLTSNLFAGDDNATGKPVFTLSSTGSNYGQINHVSGDKWCLGYGSELITNGTCMLDWGTAGVDLPQLTTDATHTDRAICQDTTSKLLYFGSGTLGICLGTSSSRYKTDIVPLGPGLSAIMALRPVSYRLDAAHGDPTKVLYGFTAEGMDGSLPALVGHDTDGRPNTADYLGVVPVLVNAVQELSAANDNLNRRIEGLERMVKVQTAEASQ